MSSRGGHSEGGSGFLPAENGHFGPESKILVVRDFPQWCGRLAPPMATQSEQSQVPRVSDSERIHQSRRGVTAVRDFPPYCGRNAPRLSEEGRMKWLTSLGNKDFNLEKSVVDEEKRLGKRIRTDLSASEDQLLQKGNPIRQMVVYEEDKSFEKRLSDLSASEDQLLQEDCGGGEGLLGGSCVQSLTPSSTYPLPRSNSTCKLDMSGISSGKRINDDFILLPRRKCALTADKNNAESSSETCAKKTSSPKIRAGEGIGQVAIWNDEDSLQQHAQYIAQRSDSYDANLPPGPSSTNHHIAAITARRKVKETLREFQALYRKLLREEESKSLIGEGKTRRRPDYQAAKILKEKGKYVNYGKQIIGAVPGVEIGEQFQYFVELNIVGLHRPSMGGIDYSTEGYYRGKQVGSIAASVVASEGYEDNLDYSDVLIYKGQGGNFKQRGKQVEDQKMERGNLALENSRIAQNPVRVIRSEIGSSDVFEGRGKIYVYDGLYRVEETNQERGPNGKLVYKFKLVRIPGQPELAWKVAKKSNKSLAQEGLCAADISDRKEKIPIRAINTIDGERPPLFEYVRSMNYPNWCQLIPPKGCDCLNGCSESGNCSCLMKNGGELPYNHNGAIVEAKPLVYECGPTCKCRASCYNRVSQHGIKFPLEIFKTESRGWGVRSRSSIPSGSFICEYAGELLDEREAEERQGNDDYLFDIGNNYTDSSPGNGLSTVMPDAHSSSCPVVPESGFTIDAAKCGNIGRFINHSCSPNLFSQNVLYDGDDKRIPHMMLFALENIPPLKELSYHYHYMMDQVFDENGNIKKKRCFCGSSECSGWLY